VGDIESFGPWTGDSPLVIVEGERRRGGDNGVYRCIVRSREGRDGTQSRELY
jgi:hypothetical protein